MASGQCPVASVFLQTTPQHSLPTPQDFHPDPTQLRGVGLLRVTRLLRTGHFPGYALCMPQADARTRDELLEGYRPVAGVRDEMVDEGGARRSAWSAVASELEALGADEIARRWSAGRRMLADNGVTYHVYGDRRGSDRPWALDPVPMVIGAQEWATLEAGVVQRARLLERIVTDAYGEQALFTTGILPAELLLANPAYVRAVRGLKPAGGRWLTTVALDLGRGADGRWWVLGHRVQAPSGGGYALENRLVVSRVLPGVFRACRVRRMAEYYAGLRDRLRAMSPRVGENPRIVLLTPGPMNETYFEHAYLARYLGMTLAEGGDLTVRDDKVWLKTLGGLRRVDVILRRVDERWCDPLELRGESVIGVPGLLGAAWSGNVAIANMVGSGVAESPALLPFMPGLCRSVLGEEELLPSVATWWCGQASARAEVFARLGELVLKPAFGDGPDGGMSAVFGSDLSEAERAALLERVLRRPWAYVAQENVGLGTSAVWEEGQSGQWPVASGQRGASDASLADSLSVGVGKGQLAGAMQKDTGYSRASAGRLVPRRVMLRVFASAVGDGGWQVMPGGLTRVSTSASSMVTSMQEGGGSKDTWVLSDGPVSTFTLLDRDSGVAKLSDERFDLPSRVADNLYWLGRYAERTEGLVRLLRAIGSRLAEEAGAREPAELPALLEALSVVTDPDTVAAMSGDKPIEQDDRSAGERVLSAMFDPAQPAGLDDLITQCRRTAGLVRDRLSADAWRILARLGQEFQDAAPALSTGPMGRDTPAQRDALGDALELLDTLLITLSALAGLGAEGMTRDQGYRFLDMGRRIERAVTLSGLLRGLAVQEREGESAAFEGLLEVSVSAMTYRSRYRTSPRAMLMLDLLMMDESNPRSIAYQLSALVAHLEALPGLPGVRRSEAQRLALDMFTRVRLAQVEALAQPHDGMRDALSFALSDLLHQLPALSDAITRQFLSHSTSHQRMM